MQAQVAYIVYILYSKVKMSQLILASSTDIRGTS